MDNHLGRITIIAANNAARELSNLGPLLKEHCEPALYEELKSAIANAIGDIHEGVMAPVFNRLPDLKAEVDGNLARFDRTY